ncbi:MAG TPA: glycosyltransferase [Ktedonobacterales bacterium]|nr:glycosyltransferase [Ktedonobacterales bacterium]
MARILLSTFGSSGDLNPFLAVGLGLRARGHEVTFAVERNFQQPVNALGFPVALLTGDAETTLMHSAESLVSRATPLASLRILMNEVILPALRPKIEELRAASAGADVLVSSAQQLAASFVADLTHIPWASIALSPVLVPSPYLEPQPTPVPIPPALQPLANRVAWAMGMAAVRQLWDVPINKVRAEYGLPPLRDVAQTGNLSRQLTAMAVSPAYTPRPPDWPAWVRQTGFCFWDAPDSWHEPPELTAFLAGDRPVVALSSGSMADKVGGAFDPMYRAGIEAICQAGARALVIGAPPEALPNPLSDDVFAAGFAPFSRVYPRCAAAIHHGGMGTVAQSLRAGIPALVVPWGVDQFFAGAQLARVGAGRWLRRPAFTAERGAREIGALLSDVSYRKRAQAIAEQIAAEDGVADFIALLEKMLA